MSATRPYRSIETYLRVSRFATLPIQAIKCFGISRTTRNYVPIPFKSAKCYPVLASRHIHNLSLIGFMGTGKSSVGRLVAEMLHFTFLDTDHVIESRAGKTITQIFEQEGEPTFRSLERGLVEELTRRTRTVIATGGGLPVHEANLASLKTHSLVVCLWASPEKIYERVRGQSHRPLLKLENPMERIRQLLSAREPYYRQADVLLNTELRPLREVANQVFHQFRMAQSE
jgi:shikimate kinase